jgi:N utilization substance protein A
MRSEFALAFNEITERFGLSRDTVMQALEAAMVSAYRRSVNASTAQNVEAKIDPESGEVRVFAEKEIVDSVVNPLTEVAAEVAHQADPNAELGGTVLVESTPEDFGRVAAQTAKQVILQRLREAERDAQYAEFADREGDMVHGTVHSITPQAVTIGLGRAEAILPRNQQIPGEQFRVRDRIRVYVLEVRKSSRGPVIVVTRTHPNMLRRLLEMEVPEINQGLVEIKAIAREAGKRAKVAVAALREGIDPVGACVGLRGVRIQSIVRDLNDEKIDVIEWNPESATFIQKALSPARVSGVYLDEDPIRGKTALVVVPEDQLSLAIGRAGVNARLAARLTGWRIDIKSLVEAASDSLERLRSDEAFAPLAERLAETMPQVEAILTKKQENRPVTPEEYQVLTGFVERVQREVEARRSADRQAYADHLAEIRAAIPVGAYQTNLDAIGLSDRVLGLMTGAGYTTAAQALEQLGIDEDKILALEGFGPKAMEELRATLAAYVYPEVQVPTVPEVAAEVAAEVSAEVAPEAAAEALVGAPGEVALEAPAEVGAEAAAEALPGAEGAPIPVELPVTPEAAVATAEAGAATAPEGVAEDSLERAFQTIAGELRAEAELIGAAAAGDDEEPEAEGEIVAGAAKKAKKRKKGVRTVEYDPATGQMVVRKRRKPGRGGAWDEGEF